VPTPAFWVPSPWRGNTFSLLKTINAYRYRSIHSIGKEALSAEEKPTLN
jgi:hypothetical protein